MNIGLLLYVDDCEIANPLGSKAGMHKVGVIYCTILNLPPKFRSSSSNCYLIPMYNSGDVKTYGFGSILQPVVDDIKYLEREGIIINTDVFKGVVKVRIPQLTGDNLGVNGICDLVEGFVSHHFCRNCKMHINEMRRRSTADRNLHRNRENYVEDLRQNDASNTGIKAACLLNNLEHFHIMENYAPV